MGPTELKNLTPVFQQWANRLWFAGEQLALADPLRVDVLSVSLGDNSLSEEPCAFPWTFALDPATVSRSGDDFSSHLVADSVPASQLRQVRNQSLLGVSPTGACNTILENGPLLLFAPDDPTTALSLWIRDALPLEDQVGRISLPEPQKIP